MSDIKKDFSAENGVTKGCKNDLSKYFHPYNSERNQRFLTIYKLFSISDTILARELSISRTSMNRYRRGIFEPSTEMKLLIARAISKIADYPIDTCIIFGDELFFNSFKKECEK